jgi:hypothetical protein
MLTACLYGIAMPVFLPVLIPASRSFHSQAIIKELAGGPENLSGPLFFRTAKKIIDGVSFVLLRRKSAKHMRHE